MDSYLNRKNKILNRAKNLLENWISAMNCYWYEANHNAPSGCFGPGYLHWGVQSNWNYLAAVSTLSSLTLDPNKKSALEKRAIASLRFALNTHITGREVGNDGKKWGNSWISILGIERAFHGLKYIKSLLSNDELSSLHCLLINEADWILYHGRRANHKGVCAAKWNSSGCNNPESNIWNGCFLHRIAHLYPHEKNRNAWLKLADKYLVNGISVEADADDQTIISGIPVKDWHVGANFFPSYALDHHGYLNVGYMVICISNAAILHFDFKSLGIRPPESLYHHQLDLWNVLSRMIFEDGRLARIGGDTRVRYAYCQEYLLPSLLFAMDFFNDSNAFQLVESQLDLMEREAVENEDGSFYSKRLENLRLTNPHYYTRIESDRACVLSMLLNYLPLIKANSSIPKKDLNESSSVLWIEEEHGAVLHRSPTRFSSFSWRADGLAQALCLPPQKGDLAEWSLNMCPVVRFIGDDGLFPSRHRRLLTGKVEAIDGGFIAYGSIMEGVDVVVDEGGYCTDQAISYIAFSALPDNKTCICLQYVIASPNRVGYIIELKALHLNIPNDLFNNYKRVTISAEGSYELSSPPSNDYLMQINSKWLNIDEILGISLIYGADCLQISRSKNRRGGRYKTLFIDEICTNANSNLKRCVSDEILVDIGFLVFSNASPEETKKIQ
ncbi:MAG TPA: hypothetical protein P5239_05915, partial [Victivallales bacterium]|nr:hypothetical protein [Victivallales bacterium]